MTDRPRLLSFIIKRKQRFRFDSVFGEFNFAASAVVRVVGLFSNTADTAKLFSAKIRCETLSLTRPFSSLGTELFCLQNEAGAGQSFALKMPETEN